MNILTPQEEETSFNSDTRRTFVKGSLRRDFNRDSKAATKAWHVCSVVLDNRVPSEGI
jgi:hypothetical protein